MAARAGRRWLAWLLVTCLAAAACLLGVAGWKSWPWRERYPVAVPAPTASPRQVVLAYLRALDAHDSATAEALSAPGFRGTAARWLSSTASLTRIRIDEVGYFPRDPAGRRYWVLTEFRYASHWWDQDPSFADGDHVWGYYLIRSHGRYLIDDEGLG